LVLDNCAGSGTTGVACENTGRNYILIEKEKEYFDIIEKRLKGTTPPLFVI
jgi:site-specific DNA-methyltransferase (adenine-specific)